MVFALGGSILSRSCNVLFVVFVVFGPLGGPGLFQYRQLDEVDSGSHTLAL